MSAASTAVTRLTPGMLALGTLVLGVLLGGCAGGDSRPAAGDARTPAEVPAESRLVVYECGDGRRVEAYFPPGRVLLNLPERTLALPQVSAASGARYADGGDAFWSQGREATLSVAGSSAVTCREDRDATAWERARLSGIDYRALGQEPGWMLAIRDGRSLTLTLDYGQSVLVFPAAAPDVEGERRIYRSALPGYELKVTIEPTPCRDAMSGAAYPETVVLAVNHRTLRGCGQPLR